MEQREYEQQIEQSFKFGIQGYFMCQNQLVGEITFSVAKSASYFVANK